MQTIDTQIVKWFDEYHEWEELETMLALYEDLVDEELWEIVQAIWDRDMIELVDWLWDTYWVVLWAWHFYSQTDHDMITDRYYDWLCFIRKAMGKYFVPVMEEIIKSNFTKIKDSTNNGKIKKWPNFVKPNIDLAISQ